MLPHMQAVGIPDGLQIGETRIMTLKLTEHGQLAVAPLSQNILKLGEGKRLSLTFVKKRFGWTLGGLKSPPLPDLELQVPLVNTA